MLPHMLKSQKKNHKLNSLEKPHMHAHTLSSSSQALCYWESEQRGRGMCTARIKASQSHHQISSNSSHPSSLHLFPSPCVTTHSCVFCVFSAEECVRHLLSVLPGGSTSGTFCTSRLAVLLVPKWGRINTQIRCPAKWHVAASGVKTMRKNVCHRDGFQITEKVPDFLQKSTKHDNSRMKQEEITFVGRFCYLENLSKVTFSVLNLYKRHI